MRLLSLRLLNFRQYRQAEIRFQDGITAIVGRNGAGKTTLLEAIAWTLYGQKAIQRMDRGKAETIKSRGAGARDHTECELAFELGGQRLTVVRRMDGAALLVEGQTQDTGTENVTRSVTRRLGMDPQAFFTSFFTGQKDLAFLRDVSSRKREEYVGRLLGYERLTRAREMANQEKLAVAREMDALSRGAGDLEEAKQRRKEAEERLQAALEEQKSARGQLERAQETAQQVEPEKKQSEEAERRHRELQKEVDILNSRLQAARERIGRLREELGKAASARSELEKLQPLVEEYERLRSRNEELNELEKADAERRSLEREAQSLRADIEETQAKLADLSARSGRLAALQERLASLRQEIETLQSALERRREERMRQAAEVRAARDSARQRAAELGEHLEQLLKAGPDGVCPTCERPLREEFERVTSRMRSEQQEALRVAGDLEQKLAGLEGAADPLETAKLAELQKEFETVSREDCEAQAAATEESGQRQRLQKLRQRLEEIENRREQLPSGFDPQEREKVRARGSELRPLRDKALSLRTEADRVVELEKDLQQEEAGQKDLSNLLESRRRDLEELNFSPEKHAAVISRWEQVSAALQTARERLARADGDVSGAQTVLENARREEAACRQRQKLLEEKRSQHRHLETLSQKFDELRSRLNSQIRPGLSERASQLITALTDGRYSQVDLDEEYTPRLFDDGEFKPVISGGEEDILHLSLRLAISQMIAERAGLDMGLLVLDEVFGSLDESRRDSVLSLLQNLKGAFPQILLITHIETIHDMVDRCIWVEYDAARQTSVVRESLEMPLEGLPGGTEPALALE
ncbi:MAG: double-stranded DNA repair protein Rad50 [Armatimonadota bacterium]|nr:MAG: double-stranded DNA repair protein Rad50 [Armatimonadota bacterium]